MSKLSAGAAFHSLTSSQKTLTLWKPGLLPKDCTFTSFRVYFQASLENLDWNFPPWLYYEGSSFSSSSSKGNKHGRWEVGKLTSAPIPTHFHRFYPRGTFKNICLSQGADKKVGGWEGRQSLSKDGNHLKRSAAAAAATACGGAARPGRVTVERRSL